jgi:hypothetical protein
MSAGQRSLGFLTWVRSPSGSTTSPKMTKGWIGNRADQLLRGQHISPGAIVLYSAMYVIIGSLVAKTENYTGDIRGTTANNSINIEEADGVF